jgi:hypothetical protein
MTRKSTSFIVVIALAAIAGLLAFFYPRSNDVVAPAAPPVSDQGAAKNIEETTETPDEVKHVEPGSVRETVEQASAPVEVSVMEEQPVLGTILHVREVREAQDDSGQGAIRNLEFTFRPGVLPRRLFGNNKNVLLNYDQLYKNDVGAGAVTIRFYYEIVTADTNGDGILSGEDKFDVAVSYADGSGYVTLVSNVDKVLEHEQIPPGTSLRLVLQLGDKIVERVYSLETNKMESEQVVRSGG